MEWFWQQQCLHIYAALHEKLLTLITRNALLIWVFVLSGVAKEGGGSSAKVTARHDDLAFKQAAATCG